jgi:hypothetical protein
MGRENDYNLGKENSKKNFWTQEGRWDLENKN